LINLIKAKTTQQIQVVRQLFTEYAESLDFELCFQDFGKELEGLPGDYAEPDGFILLAESGNKHAGCIALRKIEGEICEMKHLYVRPEFRGEKTGRLLAEKIIDEAKKIGYNKMRLDTTPKMKEAIKLYKSLGFREIQPYRYNPIEGAIYMEKEL
jgi:ribosomal protein S18 acetylase RimI-like enzyme